MAGTLQQLVIKNASFKAALGTGGTPALTEYADHIDNAALNSTSAVTDFKAISGLNGQEAGDLSETIVLNLGQDLRAASLWMFLRTNHGKKGRVEFCPKGGTTPKVSAIVTFQAPGALGGAAGAATSGATLLVEGLATITADAAV